MAKMKKTMVAGGLVREVIYPAVTGRQEPKVRAGKRKLSSEAQRRMNDVYLWQKLEMQLAANFRRGALILTLTYRPERLPKSRKQAEARLKYFRHKLTALRGKRGLVMFWATEHKHGDGRWHHHCVINATGNDYKMLLAAWGNGEIEIQTLRVDKDKNFETLAKYMTKESREDGRDRLGQRAYSYTRSAAKVEVDTVKVPDDTPLQAPKGSLVFAEASERTEYGSYRYIKYYIERAKSPRNKRRK